MQMVAVMAMQMVAAGAMQRPGERARLREAMAMQRLGERARWMVAAMEMPAVMVAAMAMPKAVERGTQMAAMAMVMVAGWSKS